MAAPAAYTYTDIGAVQAGGANILANLLDPNLTAGRIKTITAVYTMTGSEAANDAIYIARVPSGSIVDPVNGSIATVNGNAAAALTMSVGDTDTHAGVASNDPARYSAALDVAAATTTVPDAFSGGSAAIAADPTWSGVIVDDWVWLIGVFTTLTTPAVGKKLVFRIRVTMLD